MHKNMSAITPPRPRVQALAACALELVCIIEEVYPVEGRLWRSAGRADTDPAAAEAMQELASRLAKAWSKRAPVHPFDWPTIEAKEDDPPATADLIAGVKAVLDHYGWRLLPLPRRLRKDGPPYHLLRPGATWHWPDVPTIRAGLLSGLTEAARALLPQAPPAAAVEPHPDGPEGGRWLWWAGIRHDVPGGVVYQLINYMWARDSACYDDLEGPVFDADVAPGTIRARASDANKALKKAGVPWRLRCDSTTRHLTRESTGPPPGA
jgi:hypothetical protein